MTKKKMIQRVSKETNASRKEIARVTGSSESYVAGVLKKRSYPLSNLKKKNRK